MGEEILIGRPEKSFLTRSSNIATTVVDTSWHDVYSTSLGNVQSMTDFTEQQAPLKGIVPLGCPRYITTWFFSVYWVNTTCDYI